MKYLIYIILVFAVALSCGHQPKRIERKLTPEYKGIAQEIQPFVDEYKDLAQKRRLTFKHQITAGFKTINSGNVIGLCNYGKDFRELDIDIPWWSKSAYSQQRILVFHELTHCLCSRAHDWAKHKDYPEAWVSEILDNIGFQVPFRAPHKPGYFMDGCPLSIMAPNIVSQDCIDEHEDEYLEEMFDRCQPY